MKFGETNLAHYCSDFLVRTANKICIVETKADKDVMDANVRQKQKSTLSFVSQINNLLPESRDNLEWEYLLLSDARFYTLSKNGADFEDIANVCRLTAASVSGNLFDS